MKIPNPLRHWKIILAMSALFLLGLLSGAVLTAGILGKLAVKILNYDGWEQRTARDYRRRLSLSPEQERQVMALFRERRPEMLAIRNEMFRQSGVVQKELNEEVLKILTPEQAVKFRALTKLQEERFRKAMKLEAPPARSGNTNEPAGFSAGR